MTRTLRLFEKMFTDGLIEKLICGFENPEIANDDERSRFLDVAKRHVWMIEPSMRGCYVAALGSHEELVKALAATAFAENAGTPTVIDQYLNSVFDEPKSSGDTVKKPSHLKVIR